MAIDILNDRSMNSVKDGIANGARSGEIQKQAAAAKANVATTGIESVSRNDAFVLTDSAKALSRATAKAKADDGIDTAKVEKFKAAIANGSYTINADSIAGKMVEEEAELSSIFG